MTFIICAIIYTFTAIVAYRAIFVLDNGKHFKTDDDGFLHVCALFWPIYVAICLAIKIGDFIARILK